VILTGLYYSESGQVRNYIMSAVNLVIACEFCKLWNWVACRFR